MFLSIVVAVKDNAGFYFLDLYLTNQIMPGSIMISSFIWNQILLLCPFHVVRVSLEKMSLSFGVNRISCDFLSSVY